MKRILKHLKRTGAFLLSVIMMFTLFSVVPIVSAQEPIWSDAFVNKLISEHPLSDGQLYVGYGKESIMPLALDSKGTTNMPLGGYGREENRLGIVGGVNSAVQQEIFSICTAVMDGNGNIILFIINDINRSTKYASISQRVSEVTGVPVDNIYISATHTHAGPAANTTSEKILGDANNYYSYQEDQIAKAALAAICDLYPADMYIKSVDLLDEKGNNIVNFVRNYDTNATDYNGDPITHANNHGYVYWNKSTRKWESVTSNSNGVGITGHKTKADPQLQIIRFEREDNNNVLMCNFQAHPIITGGSSSTVISSDYPGSFRRSVEEALPDYRVAYYQGAAGNINPVSNIDSERYKVVNNTGKDIVYDFNNNGSTITWKKGTTVNTGSVSGTNSGVLDKDGKATNAALKRLACYLIGQKMSEYITKDFSLPSFEKVNGGTVKQKKYTYSTAYHLPEDDITNKSATWLYNLIWTNTDAQLKEVLIGTYAFSETDLENMSVINESVTSAQVSAVKAKSKIANITDEQATIVAKFLNRVQGTINQYSTFYTSGGTNSFFDSSTTTSNRFDSVSRFSTSIRQEARNQLIHYLGAKVQSQDGGKMVESPYHASAIVTRIKYQGKNQHVTTLSTATIGDVSFAGFPGEMFDTNAMYVKDNTATKMAFILCYTNGASGGYFPSAYGYLYSTYESDTTSVNIGTAELWAGMQSDFISDLTFEDETFDLTVGDQKALTKADGSDLYAHTDNFDYSVGLKYSGGSDLNKYSYKNTKTTYKSSNTAVATVSENGVITAVGKGTAVITVVHTGGNATNSYSSNASCTVVVGDHNHCDECGDLGCKDETHKKHEFVKWSSTTELPTTAGYYYLENNITLSAAASIGENVIICLNGKTVTAKDTGAIDVTAGKTVVCNCKKEGEIAVSGEMAEAKALVNVTGGRFVLTGGTVNAENATSSSGTAIKISQNGTAVIAGGVVLGGNAGENGSAIYNLGTLSITGGTVKGKSANLGGAIYTAGNKTEITGGIIEGGTAALGGALYVADNNTVISGGKIHGGTATTGGCVAVNSNCTFNITGGTISGGVAKNGGCIYLTKKSTVNMSGGTVLNGETLNDSTSSLGGNVYVYGTSGNQSVFNLTGGTIYRGTAYGMGGNVAGSSYTEFNMSGGTIDFGTANRFTTASGVLNGGHGGNMYYVGTFNLSGGTITNGVATSNGGGNFSVNGSTSRLYMTGGIIKNGSSPAQGRGNVYIWNNAGMDCFEMTGGKITDDTSKIRKTGYYGGGVYVSDKNANGQQIDRTIKISGDAVITGNILTNSYNTDTGKTTYTYRNVYLEDNKYITVGRCVTARVGVTLQSGTGTFTIGGTDCRATFVSDVDNYYVVNAGDNLAISDTPDTSADKLLPRDGSPSDIALEKPGGITPEPGTIKDDYTHFNIEKGASLNLTSVISGVTNVRKTSNGSNVTLSGTTVTGNKEGAETFSVTTSSGTIKVAVAVGHYHCRECGTFGCQIHSNVLYNASSTFSVNKSQNIYLTQNISLTAVALNGSSVTANVCLNGHTVTGPDNNRVVYMQLSPGEISFTDCSAGETGKLIGNAGNNGAFSNNGGLLSIASGTTFSLYRGTLDASNVKLDGSAKAGAVMVNGTFNMYGGKVIGGNNASLGGAVYVPASGKFNMYGGVIDASGISGVTSGAAVYNLGTFNMDNGTVIGGNAALAGGFLYNASSGKFTMNGGTVDCFKVVASYGSAIGNEGTVIVNNGRIIGGTHTSTNVTKSAYYNPDAADSFAAIVLKKSSTMTINGGVIQDGTGIREFVYNENGTVSGIRHPGGNIQTLSGSTLNINGGIIANGSCFSYGANIFNAGGSTVNMKGGTITGGVAYKVENDDNANGSHGGNVLANGVFNMSGGTIQNGVSHDAWGGNVSIYTTTAEFNMTGGIIKNGLMISSRGGHGNVAVWYRAGNVQGTKYAFKMSGGTITCDDDLIVPDGFAAGGVGSSYSSEGYANRILISGSAKIYSNKYNLLVDAGRENSQVEIGTLKNDAVIYATLKATGKFAYNVTESAVSKIKADSLSANYLLKYDKATKDLNIIHHSKTEANRFIENHLTGTDGHYYTDAKNAADVLSLEKSGALEAWNALNDDERDILNTVYNDLCGVNDIDTLLNSAHKYYLEVLAPVEEFLSSYPTDFDGEYAASATEENKTDLIAIEDSYNSLTREQKQVANSIVGANIADIIAAAKALYEKDKKAAKEFADNYLKEGNGYITEITEDNLEKVAAAKDAWDALSDEAKAYADDIVGTDVEKLISTAVTMIEDRNAAKEFLDTYLSENGAYITEVTFETCEHIAAAAAAYGELSSGAKEKVDEILGISAQGLIKEAQQYIEDIANAEEFVDKYFTIEGQVITDTDLESALKLYEFFTEGTFDAYAALTDNSVKYANGLVLKAGSKYTVKEIFELVEEYLKMLDVNVQAENGSNKFLFYAGLDNLNDYDRAGFIIDYGYAKTVIYTSGVCTDEKLIKRGLPFADRISSVAKYVYACDYTLYLRDYGKTVTVTAFLQKSDGEYIYGRSRTITLKSNHSLNVEDSVDEGYGETLDFGK